MKADYRKCQKNVNRGDIFYADLDPVTGSEQGGIRPVIVIQNNIGNRYSPTIIVAPVTSRPKTKLPIHVPICSPELSKKSVALLEQIRTIDKCRLREWVCRLGLDDMHRVDTAMEISLGLQSVKNCIALDAA